MVRVLESLKGYEPIREFKIGVLAGGLSSERNVSLKSGKAVFEALQKINLNVSFIDVNEERFENQIKESGINLAFIALHGRFGEDGEAQKILEKLNIPYTGSDSNASSLAMDKVRAKEAFLNNNIESPKFKWFTQKESVSLDGITFPCVVKPRYEGSSIGLSVVLVEDNFYKALEKAFLCAQDVIVEEYISGRELTVGIIDGKALPVVEIVTAAGIYDYNAKYESENTKYIVPAVLQEEETKEVQDIAVKADQVLGLRNFSRVDIRFSKKNEPNVLEVNTIPGMTERSLLPMAAKQKDITFIELCVIMLRLAIEKGRWVKFIRAKTRFRPDTFL